MKKIGLFTLALAFLAGLQACVNDKKNTDSEIEQSTAISEDIKELIDEPKVEAPISVRIPAYDFAAFQKKILQKNNDTTYVINFWATWCKPCVKELPYFEKIQNEYADKKVKVILASLDFSNKIQSEVVPYLKKHNVHTKVVLLKDGNSDTWVPKVSEKWTGAIPATLIYKNDARKFYEQSFTYKKLKAEVESMR